MEKLFKKRDYGVEARKNYNHVVTFILMKKECPQIRFEFETRYKPTIYPLKLDYEVIENNLSVSFFGELMEREELALIPLDFIDKIIDGYRESLNGYIKDYLPVVFNTKGEEPYVFIVNFKSISRPISLNVNVSNGKSFKGIGCLSRPLIEGNSYSKKQGQNLSSWIFTTPLKNQTKQPPYNLILRDLIEGIEEGFKEVIESPAFNFKREKVKRETQLAAKNGRVFIFAAIKRNAQNGRAQDVAKIAITQEGECIENMLSIDGNGNLKVCRDYLIKKIKKFYYRFEVILPRYNGEEFSDAYQKFLKKNRFRNLHFIPLAEPLK